jgi:L-ascorbate metabolism protein UlaG (beta-lactamase superfamily)
MALYLANPEMHAKASENTKFLGGPFIDVPISRSNEIEELLKKTESVLCENIEFANALIGFSDLLSSEAKGQSLEPYYEKVPQPLRGYVELVYDYYNHPIVKLNERLLYESPYYKPELQSLRISRQIRDDGRSFFLSTPRLPQDDQIEWAVPFDSSAIDQFFKLDLSPQPLGYISELLCLRPAEEKYLLPLLSTEPSGRPVREDCQGVRIRYFGHACVLVEWAGVSILTDPWVGVISEEGVDHLSYRDLPEKIDYVLITHGHHDHFSLETLLRLRHRIGCLVVPRASGVFYADPSLKLAAQQCGFPDVIEIDSLESIDLPDGEIIGIPFLGEHADLPHSKIGYLVRSGKEQILFAADSNCLDGRLYQHLSRILGPIGTVFLGMECVGAPLSWLYGALLPVKLLHSHNQSRRTRGCNAAAAIDLLQSVGSKRVYIYAMGSEPWLQYGMGLGLAPDSPQMRESERVLEMARTSGFADAQRPFLRFETCLR